MLRAGLVAITCCLWLATRALADDQIYWNIPAGDLITALETLTRQSGAEIAYQTSELKGLRTAGIVGLWSVHDAVSQLLHGTGLEISTDSSGAMFIYLPDRHSTTGNSNQAKTRSQDRHTISSITVPDPNALLSEVVVTAEKRSEQVRDVPVSVTVISSDTLVEQNKPQLTDYFDEVPGFTVVPVAAGTFQSLSIRGIFSGSYGGNPLVGVVVDDVPFGASTLVGGGGGGDIPDLDPSEVARVEVLRGPQGTLYGASTMGGLLKFVTLDPSTQRFSGQIEADTNSVYNGSSPGYGVRGSMNLPVDDSLALSLSAFDRKDAGYIDNPVQHIDGVNAQLTNGGRLAALWTLTDAFTLKFSAMSQATSGNGASNVDILPGLSDLQQNNMANTGQHNRQFQIYSATETFRSAAFDLTSITGFNVRSFFDSSDATATFGMPGVIGATFEEAGRSDKFSQEIRVASHSHAPFDWILGTFYTRESERSRFNYLTNVLASSAPSTDQLFQRISTDYQEFALFGDLILHLRDNLDIQLGGRTSHINNTLSETDVGAFVPIYDGVPSPMYGPLRSVTAGPFTYLATPTLRLRPNIMAYIRLASGYRAGGNNIFGSTSPSSPVPLSFRPDTTKDFELGIKAGVFGEKLFVDASLYHIDWRNLQILSFVPQNELVTYTGNAGAARSDGLELSLEIRPATGLRMNTWVAVNNAVLTQSFPDTAAAPGVRGDRLPDSSRLTGNFSIQQDFRITQSLNGSLGGSVSYISSKEGEFVSSGSRPVYPAYAKLDLHFGLTRGPWNINLFANNVTDRRGIVSGGTYPPYAFIYIQPRSLGIGLTRSF